MSLSARSATALFTALGLALCSADASASGFFVTDRGVRPMGRAGAFVAGADDQHSIWYNPAGLTSAGNGVLADFSYIAYGERYQRQAIQPGSDIIHSPEVQGRPAPLPIPTLVASHDLGVRGLRVAFAIFAPNAVITTWPSPDDGPAPQRYSLITLDGSLLAMAGLYVAYAPNDQFSFGVGLTTLTGTFNSRLALSACPATVTCQPEDPDWDSVAQLSVGPIFSPSATAGIRWRPSRYVTFGVSGQLPHWVSAPARLQVRLPSHPFYDGAEVSGDRAEVKFMLAPVLRAGIEVRPVPELRIEAAVVIEGWSVHDQISLTPVRDASQPNGIQIRNVRGVGTYDVGATAINRQFMDAFSFRLGAEYDLQVKPGIHLWPRIGASYDTSATPPQYTSVLTLDTNKFLVTVGASIGFGRVRVDLHYLHAFTGTVSVDPRDAGLYPVAPFRAGPGAPQHAINGGVYNMSLDVIGLGLRYAF